MMKLIIFDMDGVLVDAKKIHFETLNAALDDQYKISWEEHLSTYDGLKTKDKLNLLSKNKKLPETEHENVYNKKQALTLVAIQNINSNSNLIKCIEYFAKKYKLAVCSNSIRKTTLSILSKLDIIQYFDLITTNEDVNNPKPYPEMYWKTMSYFGCLPEETMIVEDSPVGLLAASKTGCNILRVLSSNDITIKNIENKLEEIKRGKKNMIPKWVDKKLNVLIPMAGAGSRFEKAGYTFPKPLIEVNGKPMIQVVVENLNIDANFIYVVQKTHREKYNLDTLLNLITPNCKIVETDGITDGAARTALLAKEFIDNNNPLFFANSDQYVEWNSNEFMYKMQETGCDGGIVTFKSTHPKWSFAQIDNNDIVTLVAEKKPISDNATVGFYYWKHGSDFVKYANRMIDLNIRVNNEFYVCPVFNEAIKDNKKIRAFNIEKMYGLGTPEDLNNFTRNLK